MKTKKEIINSIVKTKKRNVSITIKTDLHEEFYRRHPKLIFSHVMEALLEAFLTDTKGENK